MDPIPINDTNFGGTSISTIKSHLNNQGYGGYGGGQQQGQFQYNPMLPSLPPPQYIQQGQQGQQGQQPYYRDNNNEPNYIPKRKSKKKKNKNFSSLASDINRSLENYNPLDSINIGGDSDDYLDSVNSGGGKQRSNSSVRDIIIICILFVILSQNSIRSFISNYIPFMKLSSSGNLTLVGLLINGLIFGIVFVIIKKILH